MFDKSIKFFAFLRDVGLVLGLPALIAIGASLHKTEVASLNAQVEYIKELQYDKAVSLIKAKDETSKLEKEQLQKSIQMLGGGKPYFDDFASKYMCLKLNPR